MPEYTLNPAVITGELPQMPQINANNGVGINTTPLSAPSSSVAAGTGAMNPSPFPWSGLIGGLANMGTSLINNLFENKRVNEQQQWNEKMSDKQWERDLEMWNMTNEYNSPAAQMQRYKDAGLNPISMSMDSSSAQNIEAPETKGYYRSTMPALDNPFGAGLDAQMKFAQMEAVKAATDKTKAETDQTYLENEYLDRTLEARVYGESLKNSLNEEQISKMKKESKFIEENTKKVIQETETEVCKQFLYKWDAALKSAEYDKIVTLLPLEAELLKADTAYKRAAASYQFLLASKEQNLIDNGYYDALASELKARADSAQSRANVDKFVSDLKTGKGFSESSISQWFAGNDVRKALFPAIAFLSTDMWQMFSALDATGVMKFLGIIGAGKMLGTGRASSFAPGQPGGPAKYPTLYGPNGQPIKYN